MVSPVVPLFMAPLAIPAPGLGRLSLLELALAGFAVVGETAASPVVVVEPVLAFCASAIEFAKSAAAAMMANFILGSSEEAENENNFARGKFPHMFPRGLQTGAEWLIQSWFIAPPLPLSAGAST